MNKKLAALLIPLMLIPLASFGYAHFYDYVTKQYKVHIGSVEAKIEYFNITYLHYYDLDERCGHVKGVIGDEINFWIGNVDCTWYLNITIDPAMPAMTMDSEMLIHNVGKLPWRIKPTGPFYDGLYDTDPCWDPTITGTSLPDWLIYTWTMFRHDDTIHPGKGCIDPAHYTIPVGSTEWVYCNSYSVLIKQHFKLDQDKMQAVQKDIECHWFRLVIKFEVENEGLADIPWTDNMDWYNP